MIDKKEREEEMLKCPNCGGKLIDYTYMQGSRTAWTMQCESCSYRAIL